MSLRSVPSMALSGSGAGAAVKDKQANYRATTPSALRGEAIDGPHRSTVRPEAMTRVFAGRHDQVACARAVVRTALGPVSVVDEAVLLVSELCTNALLHTASGYDGTFEVAVYLGSLSVRIEVQAVLANYCADWRQVISL